MRYQHDRQTLQDLQALDHVYFGGGYPEDQVAAKGARRQANRIGLVSNGQATEAGQAVARIARVDAEARQEALALFGNKDAQGIALVKPFADYQAQYEALVEVIGCVPAQGETGAEWRAYIEGKRSEELDRIISEEGLVPQEGQGVHGTGLFGWRGAG